MVSSPWFPIFDWGDSYSSITTDAVAAAPPNHGLMDDALAFGLQASGLVWAIFSFDIMTLLKYGFTNAPLKSETFNVFICVFSTLKM